MTQTPPTGPSLRAMRGISADLARRYLVLGALYMAQGIPGYVLAAAVPPILRQQGVSKGTIGMLSLLLLPMALKFLWAPLVERWRPPLVGRVLPGPRRAWIVPTQLGCAGCLVALGLIAPTDIALLSVIALVLIVLASTQDIATDGYAVLSLAPGERPTGNAIQGGAVAASVLVGGTLGLVLYERIGWQPMMFLMAGLSLLPLLAVPWMREDVVRPRARRAPRIAHFLARPEALSVLGLALIYRASEGLVKTMEGPYLVDSGMPLDWIGYLSGAAAATVGLGGSALAAWAVRRRGVHGTLVMLGSLRSLCFAIFALHGFGVLGGLAPIGAAAVFQTLIRYMEIVALYSLFMQVCSRDQPGTDFTLLACAQLIVYQLGGMAAGHLAEALGYGGLFALATGISIWATWATRRHAIGRPAA